MSDGELMARVRAGEEAALEELYRRHGGSVWGLCRRVCRDPQMAQEVCQTVFVELWAAPDRFDPGRGTFRSWLLARSHARAVDAVRSEVARRGREEREGLLARGLAEDAEAAALATMSSGAVRRAVEGLTPGERGAISLTYFRGLSYREAAVLLGLPEGTVKSRIRAALGHLRAALEAEGLMP